MVVSASVAFSADNFVPIRLPHNIQVEIPRNWEVLNSNARITLDAAVQSRHEAAGLFDASSDLNFAANYLDEGGRAAALLNVMRCLHRHSRATSAGQCEEYSYSSVLTRGGLHGLLLDLGHHAPGVADT